MLQTFSDGFPYWLYPDPSHGHDQTKQELALLSNDGCYFTDTFQAMPLHVYTKMFEAMHEGMAVKQVPYVSGAIPDDDQGKIPASEVPGKSKTLLSFIGRTGGRRSPCGHWHALGHHRDTKMARSVHA